MRKRILCITLLSMLVIGAFAGSALAATYYTVTGLTASAKTVTASEYTTSWVTTNTKPLLTLTATTASSTESSQPSGYGGSGKGLKWKVDSYTGFSANPGASGGLSFGTASPTMSTSTTTYTTTVYGTLKPNAATATVTFKAYIDGAETTVYKTVVVTFKIPDKTKPVFSGDVTLPTGEANKALAATGNTKLVVNLANYAEDIEIDFNNGEKVFKTGTAALAANNANYNGVTAAVTAQAAANSLTAKSIRTVTFAGTPNFGTGKAGIPIKITASNKKVFGNGTNTSSNTYTLVVKPIPPTKFDTMPTDANKYDLSEKVNAATNKITPAGVNFTTGNIQVTHATLPITFTATGLPDGLIISQSAGLNASGNSSGKGTATAVIKGKPTKAGEYKNIVVTATNVSGDSHSETFTMKVLYAPEFTTTNIPTITWDKAYTTTLRASGAIDNYPVSFDVLPADKAKLPKGLSLDKNTGIFKGAFTSPDVPSGFAFGDDGEKKINITFRARNALTITPKSFDIVVKAVKPVIEKQGALQNMLDKMKLSYDHTFTFLVSADGPGTIKWDVPTLPAGVTSSSSVPDAKKAVSVLKLTGKPTVTMKNFNVKVNPSNGAGTTSYALKFNVTYPSVDITPGTITSPQKVAADATIKPIEFTAAPGPINWSAKSLPTGLKLSIDKSVAYDTKVYITGAYKAATKLDKNGQSVFTITAKNSVTGESDTYSADLRVYAEPKITTNSLPKLTTGKPYSAKILGTGSTLSKDMTWTVTMTPGSTSALPAQKSLPMTKGASLATYTVTGGTSKLTAEQDPKTGMITITGSLDRIPSGELVKVAVTLTTPYGNVTKNLSIDVNGVAPKFVTSRFADFKTSVISASKIAVTGTQPITLGAYIDGATMAKYDSTYDKDLDGSFDLTRDTFGGFSFNATTGEFKYTTGDNYAFNGLPITFWATNGATSKPVLKVIKVNVKGAGIQIVDDQTDAVASSDITIFVNAGGTVNETYSLSGDINPFEVTVSPLGTTKNGVTTAIDADDGTVTIGGTPTAGKETKTPITITAKNKATNQKHVVKLTVIGMVAPEIKTKDQVKEVEVGKAVSLKLQASGSKMAVSKTTKEATSDKRYSTRDIQYNPIKWAIDENGTNKLDDLVAIGLSFDAKTGAFKGVTTTTTSADGGVYTPYVFTVKAMNDAGDSETRTVTIGVKGKKYKFTHKQIVINKGNDGNDYFLASPDMMLKTDIASQDTSAYVKFAWVGNTYSTYGFDDEISRAGPSDGGNYGKLAGDFSSIAAVNKGVNLKISADNIGTLLNGTVKVVIQDAAPEIEGDTTKEIQAEKSIMVSDTMDFTLKDDPTGDTKIKWSIGQKPTHPILNVTLKPSSDGTSALATLKVQKTSSTEDITSVFSVTAQNTSTKAIARHEVTVTIKGITDTEAKPEDKDALPEDKKTDEATEEATEETTEEATEAETVSEDAEVSEGTVAYGDARTEEWLTADERAAIEDAGYVIAAILPEITADADGQYDLDAVTLAENAPEGESLVWFAFPRNAEKSDDDTIAEFYDEAGAEITAVPESRNVIASPWLRKDVTYAPVIAVKAPVTHETKDSLDEAEEGDTVTLEALEEAAENVSEDEAPADETSADEAPVEE